jgi:muconate cycloisomerase
MRKLRQVEVHCVRGPRKEAVRSGTTGSTPVTASEFGIVRIASDDGCVGLGEISITYPRIGFSLCHAARKLVAPRLLGLDPRRAPELLAMIDTILAGEISAPYIRAAFEMALLDWSGRQAGVALYRLLGGMARERVPLAWGIYQKSPEEMAADAAAAVAAGYHAVKLKVGRRLDDDIAAVEAVARATGDRPLRLDANMAWQSVPDATRAMRALAGKAPVAWFEQPLPRGNLRGMRLLRQQAIAPVMADESLQTLRDAYELAREEAADVFNVYICEAGGVMAAAQIFALAAALDIPCILGSQAEMGVGTAAAAHLGVAVPNLAHAWETFGPLRYEADIARPATHIQDGFLYPSDAPGLGIDLDEDVLRAWRVEE